MTPRHVRRAPEAAGTRASLGAARSPAGGSAASGFVALDELDRTLAGVTWAPLQLTQRGRRPVSPRLAHAIVLHLAHEIRLAQRALGDRAAAEVDAWHAQAVSVDPVRLGALTAATADVVAGAIDALLGAGVLVDASGEGRSVRAGAPADTRVIVARRLYGPAPRAGELAWQAVADATIGSPSAWVLAHRLAELLERDGWTPLSRRVLEEALGCGTSGLRGALDRLVAGDVVERRERPGGVSVYRFTEAMLSGAAGRAAAHGPGHVPGPVAADVTARSERTPRPRRPEAEPRAADDGVVLQIGGVDLDVPAGMRVVITRAPDGRPMIAVKAEPGRD